MRIELEKIIKDGKVKTPERNIESNAISENISMQDTVKLNEDNTLEMSNHEASFIEEDLYSTAPTTLNTEYNSAVEEEEENEIEVFFNGRE